MANVKIVSKKTHEILLEGQKDSLTLLEPSVVLLQVDIKDVNRIEKDGRNVKVTLKSGEVIIISDFFDSNGSGDSSKNTLAFENKDHTLSWINYIDNHGAVVEGVNYSYVDDIEIFLYHDNSVSPWLWAALPAAGATVAIASNSDSKHHSGNDNSPTIPDDKIPTPSIHLKQNEDGSISISGKTIPNGKIFITDSKGGLHTGTANTDGSYKIEIPKDKVVDGEYSVRVMDDANNSSDNVRVKSPTADLSHDGTEVTGKALPGGTVIIKDDTGKLLGSGVADSEGNYKITITPAQTNGENLNVSVQDVSGNISADNNITAADTTPPLLPKDVTVTGNDDGSLNITGNTEPGADVTVTLPDGSTITGKADENGNIDIKVPSPAAEGDYSVVVKDQAGNESPVSDVTYSDSVAPAAPKDVTVTGNDDGSLNITGNTEPGADVTVTLPDGSTITGKADENGNIDIKVPSPAAEGDYSVVVKDQAGNESPVSDVTYSDSVAPAAPKDVTVTGNDDGSLNITGNTEPGADVTVTLPDGSTITGKADENGNIDIKVPSPAAEGDYSVVVKDQAGNESPVSDVTYSDSVAPAAPKDVTVTGNDDGSLNITGNTEPGADVTVTLPDGSTITGKADENGNIDIKVPSPAAEGDYSVVVKDQAGNESPVSDVTYSDSVAPAAPKDVTVTGNDDGSLNITGNTEPGADVTVTLPDGSTITGKADENGNIDIKVPSPAADGEYGVTVTDGAGNQSPTVDIIYGDDTAPNAPENLAITGNDDGSLNITGNTEPGADVTVTLPDGSTITGKADENGNIDIKVPSPAAEGDYSVVVKDQAGNESPVSDVTYSDSVAPAAPKDVTVTGNDDGSLNITGNTEPGADVTVTLPDGSTITGKADENGNIDIKVPSPAAEGDYSVVVKDQAGNESPVSDVTYSDSVAPAAPKDVTVTGNDDGSLNITGNTEPGADVTVTLPDGSTITGKADENGNIDIKVPSPAAEGDYSVVVKDQAGNESPVSDVTYSDSVAPAAPKDVTVTGNDDGSLNITGNTEPGADVTVTLPDGSTITGKADENGNIDIKVPSPAAEGDYSVVVKDQAGNESPVSDVTYSDSVAPAAPKDVTVTGNDDGSLNITGNTEPGADVTVTLPDGSTITGKADENGNIDIKVPSPAAEGDYSVVVKDQAGNESPVSDVTYSDSVAPAAPKDVTVTGNDDGSLNITGNTEPGADVTVTLPDGSTITGKADENGNIDIKVPSPAAEGDYSVVVKDQAGNESPVSDVTYSDSVAPAAPKDVTVTGNDDGSLNITGNTEPGADVTVTLPDGSTITGKADENGNIDIKVPSPAAEGDYSVVVKDQAGNESPVSDVTYSDSVAPAAPKDVTVTGNDDGSLNITGNTEPGADVTVTLPDGSTITGKADENGNIDIKVPSPAAEGDYSVVVKDQAGNESPVSDVTYSDSVAPAAPKDVTVTGNDDGSLNITGNTEPGADVTVTLPDGSTITGKADENGNIDIKVPSPAADGEYGVTVTDGAGNQSPTVDIIYGDDTAPNAPENLAITGNDDGSLNITGNTEPGADVTVTLPDGSTITGKADENGNIDIKVPSPAAEGDYSVVVKDQAGNESPVSDVTYSDIIAPVAPTANINHAGTEVTGTAEAGSMVIVRDAENNIVGQIIAGNDGTYKVTLSPAVNNGEELVVTATDSAGNVSSETEITAPDITPPAAIIDIVSISDDTGISDSDFITSDTSLTINGKLTGTLETNEHAQISIDGGATWLDLTVDTEGQWSFVDDRTLTNGNYDYAVRVVDDAGNVGSTDSQTVVVDASVPVNSITVDTLFSADTTPTITGTYANAMKGNDFIQVTVNGKTYTQGDGYLTVNTTNKTWSLQIPDTDAMNVAGNADVKYDITAEIIAAAGGKVADATSEELTIFKNVSINAGPNPDYVDQKPLLNGLIKLGTNESLEVKIYDNDGVLVRTFSSINGANSIDGLTIDTVANTWKIVNANWGANQLEGGNYTAKASVVTKDGSGGQSSTDQAITVIEPKVIPVDNKADDSDIGSKIYALDDGGYLLVWAQNQTKSTETNGTSNYDLVAQRYDQTGQKVGGFIKITDTPTGGSANSEGYGDRMDMWDSYGGFNVYIDANSHLTIAYTASQGQKGFVKVYDDAMNLLSTSQVSGGDYYFGFNTVATSNGNVVVYTSGTLQNYNVYFSGSNNNYATSTKLTNETNGGNGYIYGASQTPAGAAIGNKASNIESLSAISLGGSKVLIQYADFTATNINPTKQNLMVVDYASDGKATIVTSMVANIFDNGWQVGAKSFALKEGGFVSLWASNHESATAATGTAAKGTMDGFDVYARRFNYDDVTKTITALDAQEKRVNTTTDGVNGVGYSTMATGHMSGVALEHGGYVIVWTKMLSNTLSEVYSQSFDAAGNKLGGETLVSTQTVDGTGSVDTLPYVAALADGGYVVTWTNSNQDYKVNSLTADIKSVIVNADGSIRGEGEAPSMSAKYLTGEGELIGTDGVNTLDGRHGATVMEAGNGNDYIIIKDTNFDLIDGGTGSDTLVWDSKADLNLGDILSKVNSIETIHLGDENANTLTISIDDLLSISSTDMLVVQGGDTDLVKLVDQDGWVSAGTQTYRGEVYQVYTHQENIDAMLWIQHNIDVIG